MARSKKVAGNAANPTVEFQNKASESIAEELGALIDEYTIDTFNAINPPKPYLTPTGILPLDAILGGGIVSSSFTTITSTPETGKSTFVYQFCKQFLDTWKNGIVLYFDVEGVGSAIETSDELAYTDGFRSTRAEQLGLTTNPRWKYNRKPFDIKTFFDYAENILLKKREKEKNAQQEIKMLFVIDSLTSLTYSRLDALEDFDRGPAKRAAELSFHINKFKNYLIFDRPTIVNIDQIRQNFLMLGPYSKKPEKGVGIWNDYKSSSKIASLEHAVNQWLFLSKRTELSSKNFPAQNINGWIINCFTEKNKVCPSKAEVSIVFDKLTGINKFWSEYKFLSDLTPSEEQLAKNTTTSPFMDLCFKSSGAWTTLSLHNPFTGEEKSYPKKFYAKDAENLYTSDPEFRDLFDECVRVSTDARIVRGFLRLGLSQEISSESATQDGLDPSSDNFDDFLNSAIDSVE